MACLLCSIDCNLDQIRKQDSHIALSAPTVWFIVRIFFGRKMLQTGRKK